MFIKTTFMKMIVHIKCQVMYIVVLLSFHAIINSNWLCMHQCVILSFTVTYTFSVLLFIMTVLLSCNGVTDLELSSISSMEATDLGVSRKLLFNQAQNLSG